MLNGISILEREVVMLHKDRVKELEVRSALGYKVTLVLQKNNNNYIKEHKWLLSYPKFLAVRDLQQE